MTKVIAILTALLTYLTSLISAVPAFVKTVKSNPDFSWIVEVSELSERTYEEYYEFYQNNYPISDASDAYNHPERYQDMTAQYQQLLDDNLALVLEWKKIPVDGQKRFFMASLNNAMFDYKRPAINEPIMEKWGMEKSAYFTVYGVVMSWEALGNLNFSLCGAAMGFTPATMKTGGGLLNIKGGNSDWDMLPYYFDQKDDSDWIDFGIKLYSMVDSEYASNAELIDLFFVIADPKAFLTVYQIYADMK